MFNCDIPYLVDIPIRIRQFEGPLFKTRPDGFRNMRTRVRNADQNRTLRGGKEHLVHGTKPREMQRVGGV